MTMGVDALASDMSRVDGVQVVSAASRCIAASAAALPRSSPVQHAAKTHRSQMGEDGSPIDASHVDSRRW